MRAAFGKLFLKKNPTIVIFLIAFAVGFGVCYLCCYICKKIFFKFSQINQSLIYTYCVLGGILWGVVALSTLEVDRERYDRYMQDYERDYNFPIWLNNELDKGLKEGYDKKQLVFDLQQYIIQNYNKLRKCNYETKEYCEFLIQWLQNLQISKNNTNYELKFDTFKKILEDFLAEHKPQKSNGEPLNTFLFACFLNFAVTFVAFSLAKFILTPLPAEVYEKEKNLIGVRVMKLLFGAVVAIGVFSLLTLVYIIIAEDYYFLTFKRLQEFLLGLCIFYSPIFFIFWGISYIAFGSGNPFFVFKYKPNQRRKKGNTEYIDTEIVE